MAERHEEAINIWTLVLVLFPDALSPSLHIAQCQLAMGDVLAQQTPAPACLLEDSDPLKVRAGALASLPADPCRHAGQHCPSG